MSFKKRDSAKSKAAILAAARRLFAKRSIATVSIRDIAKAAGVSHGLVQQYFGNRKRLVAAIIRSEIEQVGAWVLPPEASGTVQALEEVRHRLQTGMTRFRDFATLITRAELAGVEPEKLLDPTVPTPAMALAELIAQLQATTPAAQKHMDPRLVSAYINASLFAFATMSPWLMTTVGLKPEDCETRIDEIAEISVQLIELASRIPAGQT
ncbi:MAG: TetR/AcrR family transcriptional regulator [bacterium]